MDMLIKQIPDDLKAWIAGEAQRNHRSMNKEVIAMLQALRLGQVAGQSKKLAVEQILAQYAALPELDSRSPDEILGYDQDGLPT